MRRVCLLVTVAVLAVALALAFAACSQSSSSSSSAAADDDATANADQCGCCWWEPNGLADYETQAECYATEGTEWQPMTLHDCGGNHAISVISAACQ